MQQNDDQTGDKRYGKSTVKRDPLATDIARTDGLGSEPARAHAEKAEEPVEHVEQIAAKCYTGQIHRAPHVAGECCVHKPQEGRCHSGNHGRHGERQYLSVESVFTFNTHL